MKAKFSTSSEPLARMSSSGFTPQRKLRARRSSTPSGSEYFSGERVWSLA